MNRDSANGSALTLTLSPREREQQRNRVECSGRLFAESGAEWSTLSPQRGEGRGEG